MTRHEEAKLKGQMFGMQVLLMQSLCFIAAQTEDPLDHLDRLQESAVVGIATPTDLTIAPHDLAAFQQAAAQVVVQCIEAAQSFVAQNG